MHVRGYEMLKQMMRVALAGALVLTVAGAVVRRPPKAAT